MNLALTSFLLGTLSTTNPCILPLYPGFLAYLSGTTATTTTASTSIASTGGKRALLGLAVLAGVLTMMLALGGLIALLAISIGRVLAYVIPMANLTLVILGILLITDHNPFKALPQITVPILRRPLLNGFLYGLLYGPIALPCSGPLLVSIFAISFTVTEALDKLWVFLWFGVGFGIPLLVLALLSGVFQRRLTMLFAQHARLINVFGGLLLIAIAIFDMAQNWQMLQLYYS